MRVSYTLKKHKMYLNFCLWFILATINSKKCIKTGFGIILKISNQSKNRQMGLH